MYCSNYLYTRTQVKTSYDVAPSVRYIKLPFDTTIALVTKELLKPLNIVSAWSAFLSTNCLFTWLKDIDNKILHINLAYSVDRNDCNECYSGETKQYLKKKRFQKHTYYITRKFSTFQTSATYYRNRPSTSITAPSIINAATEIRAFGWLHKKYKNHHKIIT